MGIFGGKDEKKAQKLLARITKVRKYYYNGVVNMLTSALLVADMHTTPGANQSEASLLQRVRSFANDYRKFVGATMSSPDFALDKKEEPLVGKIEDMSKKVLEMLGKFEQVVSEGSLEKASDKFEEMVKVNDDVLKHVAEFKKEYGKLISDYEKAGGQPLTDVSSTGKIVSFKN